MQSRDQAGRTNSKNVSQRPSTAYNKMHFLALTVIAVHSTLLYPLPFSGNNKNNLPKRNNVGKNCFYVHEEKGYHHTGAYERQSLHKAVNAYCSSFPHPIQLFIKGAYKHITKHIVRNTFYKN